MTNVVATALLAGADVGDASELSAWLSSSLGVHVGDRSLRGLGRGAERTDLTSFFELGVHRSR